MAPATQQPPQPHESPLHLFLPLCGQPLHHPQRTFLHHPVTQTLINPDVFGDPVELEPANLPNHGKFRTLHLPAASAWPASRLELTPSTSTPTPGPASTATTAVHHLIDLYLAKGHLAAACRWFLRAEKSSASARRNAAFCVCVCPTLYQRVPLAARCYPRRGIHDPPCATRLRSWVGREG